MRFQSFFSAVNCTDDNDIMSSHFIQYPNLIRCECSNTHYLLYFIDYRDVICYLFYGRRDLYSFRPFSPSLDLRPHVAKYHIIYNTPRAIILFDIINYRPRTSRRRRGRCKCIEVPFPPIINRWLV